MTLKKIDYSKLVIYKICCKDLHITDLYVGSTTNFIQRKKQHKNRCYNKNSEKYYYKLYQTIRDNGGFDNWLMVIVESCPCEDSYNARKLERFYYEQLKATLNMLRPLTTEEERREKNKEYKQNEQYKKNQKQYNLKYREEHKDELLEKQEEYNNNKKEKITCSCGAIFTKGNIARHELTFKHISKSQSLFT